ncbi:MAG TPA: hypothetical protein DEA43_00645 [Candidatus Moranbacteria bacterium]|nr:hypothetical protein [Candidatus Moranbacteria bacterium]HBT45379.1 hypothetical protein [Candidatus Moranbacteria bacterium]
MLTTVRGEKDYSKVVREFMKQNGLHKIIAFSGGSDAEISGMPKDDPVQLQYKAFARNLEERIIGDAVKKLRNYQIAILTGGTSWGVPNTATLKAKEYGMKTIGVFPLAGKKHVLPEDILDIALCIEPLVGESRWGDESPIFTSLLDGVIVYGGGAGTLIECAHILKMNEAIIKNGEPVKYIVPIAGTGGVADGLPFVWGKAEVKSLCMPFRKITSGIEAVDILCEQLNLDDFINV